jgi:rhodanese-related sulfurtransferase
MGDRRQDLKRQNAARSAIKLIEARGLCCYTFSMSQKEHWENVYATKADNEVSWTQTDPRTSLMLINEVAPRGTVIDVGGGTSVVADRLLDAGYSLTVLDISEAALVRARQRLGARASQVRWVAADVTTIGDLGTFDVWHDRAVFHFLTDPADRRKYVALAERSIPVGGHLVIGSFALDGPEKCSGLSVERYDGKKLDSEFRAGFIRTKELAEMHVTPWGKPQQFHYAVFERANAQVNADTLRRWLSEGRPVVIVDVRNEQDRAKGTIPGSIHFNASAALKANDPAAMEQFNVPADACVVMVCNSGHSAATAAKLLRDRGIDARFLERGMKGWSKNQVNI